MLLFFSATLLPVYISLVNGEEEIIRLHNKLKINQRILSTKSAIESQLLADKKNPPGKDFYLKSTVESLALAELQGIVKQSVKKSGGILISTYTIKNKEDENSTIRKITIKIEIHGTIEILQKIFLFLELRKPILILDQLQIKKRTKNSTLKNKGILLMCQFTTTGFFKKAH